MLRHSKSGMSNVNIIRYFFSLSYMPMHGLLRRKICKENLKKKDQNALYMIASIYFRRCGSYRMYPIKNYDCV